MKPILKMMKEGFKKDVEQGALLQGLTDLINSNTESISKLINSNTSALTSALTMKKTEASLSPSNETSSSPSKVTKLIKPAKVLSWTKDISLETYVKQLATLQELNEDVPDYAKYHELIEELKRNKDIKGLQRFITNHILPVIKEDQTVDKVTRLLESRYGRTRTEKVEEAIEDLFQFREDQYEDDNELMLAMSKL